MPKMRSDVKTCASSSLTKMSTLINCLPFFHGFHCLNASVTRKDERDLFLLSRCSSKMMMKNTGLSLRITPLSKRLPDASCVQGAQ